MYIRTWRPVKGQRLWCKSDKREDAMLHDPNSLGMYTCEGDLVGHAPMELSSLLSNFLRADLSNTLSATVIDQRKKEKGLVVPAKFSARTKHEIIAKTLKKFLTAKMESFPSLDVTQEDLVKKPFIVYTS